MFSGFIVATLLFQQNTLSPIQLELIEICKADQADRTSNKPSEINWSEVSKRDEKRRKRVSEFLKRDELVTGEDFDRAALIFQHGNKPKDFVIAHELYLLASFLQIYGNGPAISEDRYLVSIHQDQRFGTQFDWDLGLKQLDNKKPFSVTDGLRMDMFCPPLWLAIKEGPASQTAFDLILKRLEKRADKEWQKASSKSIESQELRKLSMKQSTDKSREYVLKTYLADKLNVKDDFYNAALILLGSKNSSELLLAHELSCVAVIRRHPNAFWLACKAWDLWKLSRRELPRFGTTGQSPEKDLSVAIFRIVQKSKPKFVPP